MIDKICLDLLGKDDTTNIYKKLKELHCPSFPNDYRLSVTYNTDLINNPEYPGKYLNEFVRALHELDFPTFFVQIETNYNNIARDLAHLDTIYNNGAISITESTTDFCIIKQELDTFCVLPWMHFYFNPQGQINPCCMSDINYPLGNYINGPINFNSENIVKFRQTLLSNMQAIQCTSCYKKEKNGIVSSRQSNNKRFAKYIPVNPVATVPNFKLRYLDVRLSNICNLKCRMCSGHFSSKIADEDFTIWGSSKFLGISNSSDSEDKILTLVTEQIDNIEHIYFAGGEPLLDETHYKILDLLLEHKKHDIIIRYNTNFTIIKSAIKYWKKFNNIRVGASIDLIGSAANYVRNGAEYQIFEDNYRILQEQCPNVQFSIASILSLYNVINLGELQRRWIDVMQLSPMNIDFRLVVDPNYLSIRVLPEQFKQQATTSILKHITYLNSIGATKLIKKWQHAIKYMNNQDDSYLLNKFFEIGDIRDNHRKQNFELVFPEFTQLRDYI